MPPDCERNPSLVDIPDALVCRGVVRTNREGMMWLLNDSGEFIEQSGVLHWRKTIENGYTTVNGSMINYQADRRNMLNMHAWFCWSIFTMYWPAITFCALIGKE